MVLKTVSAFPDILSYCVGTSELRLKLSTLRVRSISKGASRPCISRKGVRFIES